MSKNKCQAANKSECRNPRCPEQQTSHRTLIAYNRVLDAQKAVLAKLETTPNRNVINNDLHLRGLVHKAKEFLHINKEIKHMLDTNTIDNKPITPAARAELLKTQAKLFDAINKVNEELDKAI